MSLPVSDTPHLVIAVIMSCAAHFFKSSVNPAYTKVPLAKTVTGFLRKEKLSGLTLDLISFLIPKKQLSFKSIGI